MNFVNLLELCILSRNSLLAVRLKLQERDTPKFEKGGPGGEFVGALHVISDVKLVAP